jgi:hypothetical protein
MNHKLQQLIFDSLRPYLFEPINEKLLGDVKAEMQKLFSSSSNVQVTACANADEKNALDFHICFSFCLTGKGVDDESTDQDKEG